VYVCLLVACGGSSGPADVSSTDGDVGRVDVVKAFPSGFRFGAATAAHQVEGNQDNNWTMWETLPQFEGKTVEPSGMATDHYNRYAEDMDLVETMSLDTFRMSIEWSRIEPERGRYDEDEIGHYRDVFEAMRVRGISPSVTLHHFTEPKWLNDISKLAPPVNDVFCPDGPSDEDMCFWSNPDVPRAFGEFCGKVAHEYGGHVDEWMTVNELTGYWTGVAITGDFPPGLTAMTSAEVDEIALPILRGLLDGHAACYRAIHEQDRVDADGDGVAARVGLTTGTGAVRPYDPDDENAVEAARQAESLATFLVFDAVTSGKLDADFDTAPEEFHAEWEDTLDIIGLQYYASTVVVPVSIHPVLKGTPCMNVEDDVVIQLELAAGCPPPPTLDFPMGPEPPGAVYGRQNDPEGMLEVLAKLDERYDGIPIVITENGFADNDTKRAASLVRHLAVCHQAVEQGIPLEGYYHWSLLDNFEWGRGYAIRFGLVEVDYDNDFNRVPTIAAEVFGGIASNRGLTRQVLDTWGGTGSLPDG